jgi:hypothetical protein
MAGDSMVLSSAIPFAPWTRTDARPIGAGRVISESDLGDAPAPDVLAQVFGEEHGNSVHRDLSALSPRAARARSLGAHEPRRERVFASMGRSCGVDRRGQSSHAVGGVFRSDRRESQDETVRAGRTGRRRQSTRSARLDTRAAPPRRHRPDRAGSARAAGSTA